INQRTDWRPTNTVTLFRRIGHWTAHEKDLSWSRFKWHPTDTTAISRNRKDLKKVKHERKALKRILCGSVLGIQETVDGQLGNSRNGRKREEKVNNNDKLLQGVLNMVPLYMRLLYDNRGTTNNHLLPVSSNHSANTIVLEQKDLTFKAFLRSALDVPLQSQYDQITTNTPVQSLVNFNEAIYNFTMEIEHIAAFAICYILFWILVFPIRPGVLTFLVPPLILVLLFHAMDLFRKASSTGIHVSCGGFNVTSHFNYLKK
ncbi:hypothetical protein A2U01_0004115, partial [Trifolium medium]|nr:hypothetical protein [Trifolium medium]